MGAEQCRCDAVPAHRRFDGDGENFGFVGGDAGENEAVELGVLGVECRIGDDVGFASADFRARLAFQG